MGRRGNSIYHSMRADDGEDRFLQLSQHGTNESVKNDFGFTLWTVNKVTLVRCVLPVSALPAVSGSRRTVLR